MNQDGESFVLHPQSYFADFTDYPSEFNTQQCYRTEVIFLKNLST